MEPPGVDLAATARLGVGQLHALNGQDAVDMLARAVDVDELIAVFVNGDPQLREIEVIGTQTPIDDAKRSVEDQVIIRYFDETSFVQLATDRARAC